MGMRSRSPSLHEENQQSGNIEADAERGVHGHVCGEFEVGEIWVEEAI